MSLTIVPDVVLGAGPATTTFATLKSEFYARGYDFIEEDAPERGERWLNQSYQLLAETDHWPFLVGTAFGQAPMDLVDMIGILEVKELTNQRVLPHLTRDKLPADLDAQTGEAQFYYLEDLRLSITPATTDELAVRYRRSPEAMSEDGHVCLIPDRYVDLVVDGAVIKALKDDDNYDAMAALQAHYDDQVARMTVALLVPVGDPDYVRITSAD